jgi:hypothetical protein
MENAPFALNRKEWAFSGKMCRNEVVFAGNSGKMVSGEVIRGRCGPGLGAGNAGLPGQDHIVGTDGDLLPIPIGVACNFF